MMLFTPVKTFFRRKSPRTPASRPGHRRCVLESLEQRQLLAADTGLVPIVINEPIGPFYDPVELNGQVYFTGNDDAHGTEIFRTDGLVGGASLAVDIAPGPDSSSPDDLVVFDNNIFFSATNDGERGLWKTDGVTAELLMNGIDVGRFWVEYAGHLFFAASPAGSSSSHLYVTDGSAAGTRVFEVNGEATYGSFLGVFGDELYFRAKDQTGSTILYKTDASLEAGIQSMESEFGGLDVTTSSGTLIEAGGKVYFRVWDNIAEKNTIVVEENGSYSKLGDTLGLSWRSGTAAFVAFDNAAYVMFEANSTYEVWRTDGTSSGTYLVETLSTEPLFEVDDGYVEFALQSIGDSLWIVGNGYVFTLDGWEVSTGQLWVSDGTPGNATLLKNGITGCYDYLSVIDVNGTPLFNWTIQPEEVFQDYFLKTLWSFDGTSAYEISDDINAWWGCALEGSIIVSAYSISDSFPERTLVRLLDASDPATNPVVAMPDTTGTISVQRDGNSIAITKGGVSVDTIPLGSVLGVTLQGVADSEVFFVDIDGLTPDVLPGGITIAAGEGTGDNDTLVLTGSTVVSNYDYTTGGPESGTITLDGFTVTFSEFEPIIDELAVENRSFTVGTAGSQTIVLGDDAQDGFSVISDGGAGDFESIAFKTPGQKLTLDAGDGDDQIVIEQVDSNLAVPIFVDAGDGNDSIDSSTADVTLVLDGGDGNDTLIGGLGSNVLIGGDGDDTVIDGGGVNTIVTGEGTDDVQLGSGENTVVSDSGGTNDAPALNADLADVVVLAGETAQKSGTFFDVNTGDSVTLSADVGSITFQDSGSAGAWNWELATTDVLPLTTVTITADDGNGGIATLSFNVAARSPNSEPVVALGGSSGTELDALNQQFTWEVTDEDGNLDSIAISVTRDGDVVESLSGPVAASGSVDFNDLGLGLFEIELTAADSEGAVVVAGRAATVVDDDADAPIITLDGSSGTQLEIDTNEFSWDVTDPSGLSVLSVVVTRDAGDGPEVIYSTTDVGDAVGTFNFDDQGVGVFEIMVVATDGDADWSGDGAGSSAGRTAVVGEVFISTTTRAKLEVDDGDWVTLHQSDMTSVANGDVLFDHSQLSHPWFSWWRPNLDAFHMLADGSMILSTSGRGEIGDEDFHNGGLVRFYGDTWLERNAGNPGGLYQTADMISTEVQIFGDNRFGTNIDAISMAPDGNLVISIAHGRELADGQYYHSGDLIKLGLYEDGSLGQSSLYFDHDVLNATGRRRFGPSWADRSVNVDGAHVLDDGRIVLTVSQTVSVGDDGPRFQDGDIFVYDPLAELAEMLFDEDNFRRDEDVDAIFIGLGNGELQLWEYIE